MISVIASPFEIFFAHMSWLIVMPILAAIPAVLFFALYRFTRQRLSLAAAVLWALYGVYETGMYLRILCGGECNIRIDLLLMYPLLIVSSALALGLAVWRWLGRGPAS